MKKMFKKTLAVLLCIWMLCLTGIAALAASEQPYETVSAVTISNTSLSMVYGSTAQLTATVQPAGADARVKWTSSNDKLVSVDSTGKLTAAEDKAETPSGKQTVTITVTSVQNPNAKAVCVVTVDNDPPTKLSQFLTLLKSLYTALVGTFADPAKQLMEAFIDFLKKLVEVLPKEA